VRNLRLVSADAYQVLLQWDAPNGSHGGAELYEVKYYLKGHKGNTTRAILSQVTSITILGLQPSSEYLFLVSVTLCHLFLKVFLEYMKRTKLPSLCRWRSSNNVYLS